MEIWEIFSGLIATIIMFWFAYMGVHIQEENRQGKHLPLLWEEGGLFQRVFKEKRKIFDKSDIKYRDGDNT